MVSVTLSQPLVSSVYAVRGKIEGRREGEERKREGERGRERILWSPASIRQFGDRSNVEQHILDVSTASAQQ